MFEQVMSRMENLQDNHIHRMAKLFGRMMVHEAAPAEEMIDVASYPFTSAAQQHYDNLLAAASMSKKCMAIVGLLHWVFELAVSGRSNPDTARTKLEMLVERLQKSPILMAFLLDAFSDLLVSHIQSGEVCHLDSTQTRNLSSGLLLR